LKNLKKIKFQISGKYVHSEQSFPFRQTDTTKLIFASEILDMPKNTKQIRFMIFLSTPFYNSSWGTQTRLWDELHTNDCSISAPGVKAFSFLQTIQTGCGAHPASIQWIMRVLSLGVKAAVV
jgi:hypothetical protein